MEDMMVTM